MRATAKFYDDGPKADSANVVDGLKSIWPGFPPVFAGLLDDGSWSIAAPASLEAMFADPDGPKAMMYRVAVNGRDLQIVVSP